MKKEWWQAKCMMHLSCKKKVRTVSITNKLGSHSTKSWINIYTHVYKSIFYIVGNQERSQFQVSCFLTFVPSHGSFPSDRSTPYISFRINSLFTHSWACRAYFSMNFVSLAASVGWEPAGHFPSECVSSIIISTGQKTSTWFHESWWGYCIWLSSAIKLNLEKRFAQKKYSNLIRNHSKILDYEVVALV